MRNNIMKLIIIIIMKLKEARLRFGFNTLFLPAPPNGIIILSALVSGSVPNSLTDTRHLDG